jgi:FlaG/FlaF family flagellin (archaellin)
MMKGVSPLMSAVLLILIIMGVASVVGPWMLDLATKASEMERDRLESELICKQTGYDFDSDYGTSGVDWNFTGIGGSVTAKIVNTKTQNLYNFTFELTFQTSAGERIVTYPDVNITQESQKTKANPLKPGRSCILDANVTNINSTWTLKKVRIINDVCPSVSPSVSL